MFLLAHIERFIGDNRTTLTEPDALLARVRERSKPTDQTGKFDAHEATEFLGAEEAERFLDLVSTNPVYLEISFQWVLSKPRC